MKAHLLFEQSGTFKKEFIKLGIQAYDYDILNDFNETDVVIDLFDEIEKAFEDKKSIFDKISDDDIVMAFFPCVRFENQIYMWFQGKNYGQRNWDDLKKLEYNLKIHNELNQMYSLITKLAIVCFRKQLKIIIENPYSNEHYLTRYWSLKPKVIDLNRKDMGDYYKKPTQYWFINLEPKNNFIFEGTKIYPKKDVVHTHNKAERSMISPEYANRFIREYILKEELK